MQSNDNDDDMFAIPDIEMPEMALPDLPDLPEMEMPGESTVKKKKKTKPEIFVWREDEILETLKEIRGRNVAVQKEENPFVVTVVFETGKQKLDLLQRLGYPHLVPSLLPCTQYIDGPILCITAGKPLKTSDYELTFDEKMDSETVLAFGEVDTWDTTLPDMEVPNLMENEVDGDDVDVFGEGPEEEIDEEKKRQMETLLAQYSSTFWIDIHDFTFWFDLVFHSDEQRAEFMQKYKFATDEHGVIYGEDLAQAFEVSLPDGTYRAKLIKTSQAILAMTRERKEVKHG